MTQVQYTVEPQGRPLAVMVSIATLEQLVEAFEAVEALIEHQYTGTREGMNALQNASDDAQAAITALRAALSNAESTQSKPYAWRNPMNGVVISNDKKERLLCVGRGYPNFSEPLYVAGAKP